RKVGLLPEDPRRVGGLRRSRARGSREAAVRCARGRVRRNQIMLRSPSYDPDLRRRRLIVLAIVTALLLISTLAYALLSRDEPHSAPPSTPPVTTVPEVDAVPSGMPDDGTLPELPPVTDPEDFAELVAHAIFDWDTSSLAPRAGYLQRIATVAD